MKSSGSNGDAVTLAFEVLDMPEGPSNKELQKQARVYLKELSSDEYEELKHEALTSGGHDDDSQLLEYKYKLHKRLGFTDTEAHAYCACRLNSPGVRRVIARRALLLKMKKWKALPRGMTFYEVAKLEDSMGLTDMVPEEVLRRLYGRRYRA